MTIDKAIEQIFKKRGQLLHAKGDFYPWLGCGLDGDSQCHLMWKRSPKGKRKLTVWHRKENYDN
jgi:hypothetical protein